MLIPHMCKLYSAILNSRLYKWTDDNNILNDEQNGFLKGRSCQDQLLSFFSIVQTRKSQGSDTYCAFVDFSRAYDTIPRDHLWFKLSQLGVPGRFLHAVKSLYVNTKCSVRTSYGISEPMEITRGLKQGCLSSPLLFNIYLNDLVTELKSMGKGVNVNRLHVPVLLYADDIVLFANSPRDLQDMLNKLVDWCSRWGLMLNCEKTKIVHFRSNRKRKTNFKFTCGDSPIAMCEKYKYLGLWFTEHLDMMYMAKQVAATGHRALGYLIANAKTLELSFTCFSKLYGCFVQSILDYGACIWGHYDFKCINAVQHRAMRFFMGVPSKTPTAAIQGEMGWVPQCVQQWICVVRQFCHYSTMENYRVNKHIFKWALRSSYFNWATKCENKFNGIDMQSLLDLDIVKCKVGTVADAKKVLIDNFVEKQWLPELTRVRAKRGPGLNKLRKYCLIKREYGTESYIMDERLPFSYRKAVAQIRCGVAPLQVERGRYDHGVYVPENERICKLCGDGVEDEFHVLFHCVCYQDLQANLINDAFSGIQNILNAEDAEKYIILMSEEMIGRTAKTCKKILDRRKDYLYF